MSRGRRYGFVGILLMSMLGVFTTLVACSDQGEGDRCQAENGNQDCQSGLVCLAATQKPFSGANVGLVNAPYNNSDRCCPADRSQATHPACTPPTAPVSDSSIPPEATGPDAPIDSPADTSDAGSSDADAGDASDG